MDTENRQESGVLTLIARILVIVEAAGLVLMCLILNNILPLKYLAIFIGVAVVIIALQVLFVSGKRASKVKSIVSIIISLVLIALSVYVVIFIRKTENQLQQMTEETKVATTVKTVSSMDVYVRKTDGITQIMQLSGKKIGVLDQMDEENVAGALDQLGETFGQNVEPAKYAGIVPLINSLKNAETDAIVINTGYSTAVTENDSSFKDWAELLCTLDVSKEAVEEEVKDEKTGATEKTTVKKTVVKPVTSAEPVENLTMQPFLVYLTGMDTRTDEIVADLGNSDVNMVIAVNPNTKKILLVNVPRDYYWYLWGDPNYPDKITHAGYYGVDCSIQTMNSLFNVNINYYVKVGFNSVINIVNALGGIHVYSDYAFELEGYYIPAGDNYLDGMYALQFAREREELPGGDRARGMNQQKIITAIIEKVTSPELIGNFSEVLAAITSNVVTNLSVEDMESVVKMQLNDGASWDIQSMQVDGTGSWDYCYSLGDANDVMIPDMSTVETAKSMINDVMSGN